MDSEPDFEQYEIELALRDSDRGKAVERFTKEERKAAREEAKERIQDRMANMNGQAMDALEMGMQSEDEGIRMKALSMYLDRMAPRVGVVREETVIEVVDEGKKMTLEEIELLMKRKGLIDEGNN